MVLISGDISINLAELSVRRAGATLKLEPLTLDLLLYLVRNRGRLITKDELLAEIWKGAFVSDASLTQAIAVLRKSLADSGRQQRMIETVRGRGYRFIGPLRQAAATGNFEAAGAAMLRGQSKLLSPFVDRHRLMRELDAALEDAVNGHGSTVLLHGEPGSGKTRTADEFARTARGRAVRTFTVGAFAVASGQAYWPWLQLLESVRASGLAAEAGIDQKIGEILHVLRPDKRRSAAPLDPASASALDSHRLQIFEEVTDVIRAIGRYAPAVLVFDDIHDADLASIRLIDFVGRSLPQIACLVIVAYRDVEARAVPARAELIAGLKRLTGARDEFLGGLARRESGRLFEALTNRSLQSDELDSLYQRTAGNAFFLHQLARLEISGTKEAPPDLGEPKLPASVIDSITQHLASLSADCRATLAAVADFGLEARLPLLAATLGRNAEEILDHLSEAVTAGILHEVDGGYRFVHALISEALEGEIEPTERARRHLRAGDALAASGTASDAEVAHHFHLARAVGGAASCVQYAKRAGDAAMDSLAFDEAAGLYAQALDALGHVDANDQQRLELLLGLGMARARAGKLEPGQSVLRQAMQIARRCGDTESFAWAVFGVWFRSESDRGEPRLIADLEEAVALYTAETPLRVRLLAQLAQALWFIPPRQRARKLAMEAVELGRRLDDPEGLTLALTRAHRICQGPAEEMPQRFELSEELRRLRPRVKDPALRLEGRWHTVWDAMIRHDRVGFDLEVDALCEDARSIDQPFAMWHAYVFTACRALADGDLRRAEADTESARRIAPPGMSYFADHVHALQTIARQYLRGQFRELCALVQPRITTGLLFGWKLEQLRAAVLLGDTVEATDFVRQRVLPTFPEGSGLERDVGWISCLCLLAEICSVLRMPEHGERVYRALLPLAAYQETIGAAFVPRGSTSRQLGCLAAIKNDPKAADAHFEQALADDGRFSAGASLTLDRFEFGRVLLRRGAAKAVARGRVLLGEAHEMAAALGMRWIAAESAALLRGRAASP